MNEYEMEMTGETEVAGLSQERNAWCFILQGPATLIHYAALHLSHTGTVKWLV